MGIVEDMNRRMVGSGKNDSLLTDNDVSNWFKVLIGLFQRFCLMPGR